jgi:parvulin-like peptidyl-prolyl isomerase
LAKIKEAKAELDKSKDFELVVGKYSEGDSVKNRGDLGWFSAEEMLPEIAMAAAQLEKGKTSDIIESGLGYHIIRVEEKKTENGTDKFHIRQIFVRVPTLAQWLAQKEKEVRIFSLRRGYQWNENIGEMQFTDESLKKFEDNLEKNSPDDVSVFF